MIAPALGGLCALLAVAGVVLHVVPGEVPAGSYGSWWIANSVEALALAIPGYLVASRRPRNPMGWLLLALALAHAVTVAAREYGLHALAAGWPGATATLWLSSWTYADFPLLVPIFFLFPDGRLPSRRWRPAFAIASAITLVTLVWVAVATGPLIPVERPATHNPLAWPWFFDAILSLGDWPLVANLAALGLGLLAMVARARAATGAARRSILLVALAGLVFSAETGHEDFVQYPGVAYVGAAVAALLGASVAVAILRYGLYEIDVVVSRTLVYGGVAVVLGAAYAGVVAAAGSLLAAVVVALLFGPLRAWLQRATDRWLFGDRDDPYAVMATVGQQLDVLPALAATIAATLKLPYVAIERDGAIAAEHGTVRGEPLALTLTYGGGDVGRLLLGARSPRDRFTEAERRLFADIARQAAVAAHAVGLSEDLRRSREQLVAAREEERRRVRRDLHDGLGPTLAGISLQASSARVLLARDPAAADALLAQLVDESQAAIADVRRLVYALRPPALDELGLVPALRAQAERFPGLDVSVRAPDDVADLPPGVEVAAYRIATEALTNVSRHAGARRCEITIALNGHLEVEVRDDGGGLPHGWRPGVGVTSIRERASELGGSCVVDRAEGGGTRVLARLPLGA